MNKKITAALLLLSAFLPGCAGRSPAAPPAAKSPIASASVPAKPPAYSTGPRAAEGRELYALVETREEAEEIAALYGVELVDFSYGVATYHTEEDPQAVIARGEAEGWPKISLNQVNQKKPLN